MSTFRAQLVRRADGRWHLYVVLFGALVSQWPEHRFARGPVPTRAERSRVLTGLGYELVPGAEWVWTEDGERPGDDTSAVRLIAATAVRSRQGAAS
ncbi:DUF6303 family protein [Streptomyces jumonjinensis]|uniref:DUF6303 family protein n=1 Tax=Streptomyces jumonjinensis TaxID=1945 RepID=UPI0037B53B24